jgi:DNA-binding transcriptional MerR regulator
MKSANAFKTISEVADHLNLPSHVLRFWETKFPQIAPMKRGGGRRYYRPDDVELLTRIRDLLHGEGYTIRGVQQLLKQENEGKSDDAPFTAPPISMTPIRSNPASNHTHAIVTKTVIQKDTSALKHLKSELQQLKQLLHQS